MRPPRVDRALLLALLSLAVPAAAQAQTQGSGLPEELRAISRVRYEGLQGLGRRELRAANLKTRSPSRLPWREAPLLRLDYLRSDTASIAGLYRHYGYLDTRVRWRLEPERDGRRTRVVFMITEGHRSIVRDVSFSGVAVYPEKELRRSILARPGAPFDPAFLQLDTLKMAALYQERGHFAHARGTARRGRPDSLAIAVHYTVDEGPLYRVGEIDYQGGQRLRESLGRRELLFKPGDTYRTSRVERSIERLYETGLFQQVQVSRRPDSLEQRVDFEIRVRERRTRWVDGGIGSGTTDRFRAEAELGHRNLDTRALRGVLNSELAYSGDGKFRRAEAAFTLTEPWLLGLRLQGTAGGFLRRTDDRGDYRYVQRLRERGVEFSLQREIGRIGRWALVQRNTFADQEYEVLDTTAAGARVADSLANAVVRRYRTNTLIGSVTRDLRDDRIAARRGSIQTLSGELAGGPLAGSNSYRKAVIVSSWYTPLPNGWNLATRASAGVMAPFGEAPGEFSPDAADPQVARVPRSSRFLIGGPNSLRGYGENSLPSDGGLAMVLGNVELRIPLLGPLGLEAFLDGGNVWPRGEYLKAADFIPPWQGQRGRPGDLRYTYGVGARFVLPFGPLRLDAAWSDHPDFPGVGRRPVFQFAIGPTF